MNVEGAKMYLIGSGADCVQHIPTVLCNNFTIKDIYPTTITPTAIFTKYISTWQLTIIAIVMSAAEQLEKGTLQVFRESCTINISQIPKADIIPLDYIL